MKPRRAAQFVRVVIALLTMSAWFVASGHCALAAVLTHLRSGEPVQESCPGHAQPEKKQSQSELPCCKTLVAAPTPAKISASYDASAFAVQPFLSAIVALLVWQPDAPSAELDTGPPDTRTFAESVLQRSLLAHAPPCLS